MYAKNVKVNIAHKFLFEIIHKQDGVSPKYVKINIAHKLVEIFYKQHGLSGNDINSAYS